MANEKFPKLGVMVTTFALPNAQVLQNLVRSTLDKELTPEELDQVLQGRHTLERHVPGEGVLQIQIVDFPVTDSFTVNVLVSAEPVDGGNPETH